MNQFGDFCFFFVVGSLGFSVFKLLRIPNPALLGSMVATGALNIAGYHPQIPTWIISFIGNTMIGAMIGRQIDRSVIRRIKILARPVMIQAVGMVMLSFVCGYIMYLMTVHAGISLLTSLISGAAGGQMEMVVFGMSLDADVAIIAFVQLFRVITTITLIPYFTTIGEKMSGTRPRYRESGGIPLRAFILKDYAMLAVCAFIGAGIGWWLKIPTGALLGAMFSSGAFALCINKTYKFKPSLRHIAQINLGLLTGQRITPQIVSQLGEIFLPAMIVTMVMLVGSTLFAILLYKTTALDLATCLLCTAPAGLSQISVFAEEMGSDSFTASVFHTVRVVGIVSLYPWIIIPFI